MDKYEEIDIALQEINASEAYIKDCDEWADKEDAEWAIEFFKYMIERIKRRYYSLIK